MKRKAAGVFRIPQKRCQLWQRARSEKPVGGESAGDGRACDIELEECAYDRGRGEGGTEIDYLKRGKEEREKGK